MDRTELAPMIDHTVLGPETTPSDVDRVLEEAAEYGTNACIPPCYLEHVPDEGDVTVATVIGFPHGQHATKAKLQEAVLAWQAGADELDAVCNVGRLKAGEDEAVADELSELVAAVPIPVKVILETPLLSDAEIRRACETALEADAAMVKTATGFADGVGSEKRRANDSAASGGATVSDVELMSEYLPVKASGGIGTYEEAMAMIDAGAERIGASSGTEILEGAPESDP
ncbi:deoxyribose-phosphate aldolase [Natrialbaceae archaeon AArc-T1-2]|uniref:deoxyribose-phosphate aldolase n=1 Tax=Natrialbaceae archaeon AArc-T1-2 TaxID=3053904 RepID=UPI00255ADD76|nr:deoxyribose-phosphate aldolase [Natrialbaceae archaeon AArc-T1-2]WIV67152.1 deoxyribose-phosphate aldolase [Natrialbaceae archaeon AArc-T1-2]